MYLMYINGEAVSWDYWPTPRQVDNGTYAYSNVFSEPWSVADHETECWIDVEAKDVPARFRTQVLLLT